MKKINRILKKYAGILMPVAGMGLFYIIYLMTRNITIAAVMGLVVGYLGTQLYLMNVE